MSQNQPHSVFPSILTFLVGAALGAVVVALTTPKAGPRLRKDLKNLARRGRERAHRAAAGLRGTGPRSKRTYVWHVLDSKNDIHVDVNDLPG